MVINKIKMSYKINCNLFDNFEDFPRKWLDEKLFRSDPRHYYDSDHVRIQKVLSEGVQH